MSTIGDQARQRFRTYMMRVLAILVGVPLLGIGVLMTIQATFGRSGVVSGVVGFAIVAAVFGGIVASHRALVRCPACNAWLPPAGVNGTLPSACPSCKASFRSS